MPIVYTKLFDLLKEKGYTTYKIRQEKLIGQSTLTVIRNEIHIWWESCPPHFENAFSKNIFPEMVRPPYLKKIRMKRRSLYENQ